MSATYRSHSGTTYERRTNTTLAAPAGIANDDRLILCFLLAATNESDLDFASPTFPAGFNIIAGPTTVNETTVESFSVRAWLLDKKASSESGDYTISHSSRESDGVLVCVQGGADETPAGTSNDGDGTGDMTFTGLTTDAAGAWLGAFAINWNLWGSGNPPGGTAPTFAERQDLSGSLIHFSEGTWSGSGATGNFTKDSDNTGSNDQWIALLASVESAEGGGRTTRNPRPYPLGINLGTHRGVCRS